MECEVEKGSDPSMVECLPVPLVEEGSVQAPLPPTDSESDPSTSAGPGTPAAPPAGGDETITAKASTSESRIPVPGSGSSATSRRLPSTRSAASAASPLSSALSQRFHHVGVDPQEQEFGYDISKRFMSTIDCTNEKNHRGKKYSLSDATHSRHSDSLREIPKGKSLQGSARLSPSLCKYQEEPTEHEPVLARLDRRHGFEEPRESLEKDHTQPYASLRLSHDPRDSFIRRKKFPADDGLGDEEGDLVSYYSHELPKPKAQRLSYNDSPFSRQLTRFTKGSQEDIIDPCLSFQKTRQQRAKPISQSFHPSGLSHEPLAKPVEISKAELGRQVVVAGAEGGILRYFGRTAFADGEWCGIELERPVGKNDGSIDGVIYFICKANHGIFAPVSKVSLLPRKSVASPLEAAGDLVCYEAQKQDSTKYQGSAHKRSGLPVPKNSTIGTSFSEPKRRLSDASNKTYTIEVRNEVSLPTSPESIESKVSSESPVKPTADPDLGAAESACEVDEASLPSPGDITYDESSLGILTPDQMPDFTVTASASMSLERSPSDENVDALEDEVCEESTTSTRSITDAAMTPLPAQDFSPIPQDVSLSGLISHSDVHGMEHSREKSLESPIAEAQSTGSLVKWDSQHSVSGIEDEVLQREVKNIIRELRKTTGEVSSSGSSSPTHKTQDSIGERLPEPIAYPEKDSGGEQVFLAAEHKPEECEVVSVLKEEIIQPDVAVKSLCNIEKENVKSTNVMLAACSKDVNEFCCVAAVVPSDSTICTVDIEAEAEEEAALSSKILYGNARTRPTPAWTESVTTSVASMTISVASIDQGYIGDGEFDLRSEGGTGTVNTPTEEVKLFEGVVDVERKLNFDSSTGVTEGDVSLIEDEVEDDPNIIPRDRSARIIDGKLYHSHKELSIRGHEGTASEMESSGFYSDLDPRERDLEDESIKTDPLLETVQEINYDAGTEKGTTPEREFVDLIPKEEPEVDPCRKGEVSPENEAEGVSDSGSEAKTIQEEDQTITLPSKPSPETTTNAEQLEVSTDPNSGEPSRPDSDKAKPSDPAPLSQPKSRTYEKPWLSKPPPPKRKEEPKKFLPPPPPMPKKNVQSKLKALLESQASEAASEERRSQRPPKKNKWDEVMNKIAEGQKEEKVKPKVKEIKSKVLESLKAPTVLSPQAEKIRQERRERRERRESRAAAAAAAAAAARKVNAPERKRSIASIRSNRTSRAPSLDSLATEPTIPGYSRSGTPDHSETRDPIIFAYKTNPDRSHGASRPVSPCRSDLSSASDQSHVSNLSRASRLSTRRRLVALQGAKGGTSATPNGNAAGTPLSSSCGGPPRREPRVYCGSRGTTGADKIRKKSETDCKTKLEKIKGPKSHKLPPSKASDSIKALKPGPRTSQQHDDGAGRQHEEATIKQQLHEETANRKQLHEQLVRQLQVASKAQKERDVAERSVEALTVLVHYLTQQYDAFSMPWVKAQVASLTEQLAQVHLSLDESYAANKRFQEEVVSLKEQHELYIEQLKNQHKEQLEEIDEKHKTHLQEVENSQRNELEKFAKDQEEQLKTVALQHKEDLQQLEAKWQKSLEEEYERHLKALQQVQAQHTQELNDLKSEHQAQESQWQDVNRTLTQEKENLKQQASKLEETLLNDADYRLQAVRKMCAGLQNEVDSMKMVVDMRNTEIHELRNQVGQMARLTEELESAREKAKALQAKNEDLKAQMEKKALYERQLMNERRQLAENYQKESNVNKRLSLENEELQWKLRQREDVMSASFSSTGSTSTLDLLTRSPSVGRRHEGSLSPQVPPRSPRLSQRSGETPCSSKADTAKRRGQLGLAPNLEEESLHSTLESPPPSPCVKAVVEKSNSVSFILDLNESQSDDSFLDIPASPRPRPTRTASLGKADRAFRGPCKTRKALLKSKSNASDRNGILGSLCGRYEIVKVDSRPQSSSESEHGCELENARQSPTGVAWTVPFNQSSENPARTDMQNDENPVFSYSHQKEQSFYRNQIEDEYEEMKDGTHQFIEVVELRGRHCFKTDVLNLGSDGKLEMNKLNIMTSSSEGTSESEMSQCDIIKVGTSSESESDSSEDDRQEASLMDDVSLTSHGPLVGSKGSPWCPKEGAGEAMVTDELLSQYSSDALTMESMEAVNTPPCTDDQSLNPRRRLSYGPSSDSEGDTAQLETNDTANVDISWSEDVECDITSSSEMHEI